MTDTLRHFFQNVLLDAWQRPLCRSRAIRGLAFELLGLDVQRYFYEDRTFAPVPGRLHEVGEFAHANGFFQEHGFDRDRAGDGNSVDFLDASLTQCTAREVGCLDLAADHEQFPALEEGPRDRCHDVRQPGAGSYQCERLRAIAVCFVEVLRRNARCDFMDDWTAFEAEAEALDQMHDVPATHIEAVGIAERQEPLRDLVAIFHSVLFRLQKKPVTMHLGSPAFLASDDGLGIHQR